MYTLHVYSIFKNKQITKKTCCFKFLPRGNSKYADSTLCSMIFLL